MAVIDSCLRMYHYLLLYFHTAMLTGSFQIDAHDGAAAEMTLDLMQVSQLLSIQRILECPSERIFPALRCTRV